MERTDHILIVDDDAEIRSLLGRYLEKNGLRATAVGDRWLAVPIGDVGPLKRKAGPRGARPAGRRQRLRWCHPATIRR